MTQPLDQLDITLDVDRVINLAQVTVYPVETAGAPSVLWTARTQLHIPPGGERVIYAPFRDENGERIGAVDVITPVAGTDFVYEYNGVDVTALGVLTVTATIEATRVQWSLENTSGWATLDVTTLQIRGTPIRVYDPIAIEEADAASQNSYEIRAARLDLPMQPDPVFARAYAQYLVGRFKDPVLVAVRAVIRDRAVIANVNVFALELLDKVVISDPKTGADSLGHWIRGLDYDLTPGGFTVTLHLERADDRLYCLLDKPGYSALDSGIRLGF
jgi:hypothetical protein